MQARFASTNDIDVWLVEDHAPYRTSIQQLIESQSGMRCGRAFGSCEEMLAEVDAGGPPEVVLMDIGLPGMGGVEGVERLKVRAPATHALMLTIQETDDVIFEAICAGASGYLLKTASPDRIFDAIRSVRTGGAAMTPQVARRILTMFTKLVKPDADYDLTERELEVLALLVEGHTKVQIADTLFLSPHTIDTHLRNVYGKLHVHSRTEAVVKALREKLI